MEGEPHAIDNPAGELDGREANPTRADFQSLRPHPAAELFPLIAAADFDALVADIKQHGQVEPIVVYDGLILDGRHRHRACLQLGIEPVTAEWTGPGTPENIVLSKNLHRRHLTASQRAVVGARLATLVQGQKKAHAQNCASSQREAADRVKVSRRSIQHAGAVIAKGVPELVQAIERGDIKASIAAELVGLSKERQKFIATAGKVAGQLANREANELRSQRRAQQQKPVNAKPDLISPPSVADLPMGNPRQDDVEYQLEGLAFENDRLRAELADLGPRLNALQEERDRLNKQVAIRDKRIKVMTAEITDLKATRDKYRRQAEARVTDVPPDANNEQVDAEKGGGDV
jgi:ParB-like chromosome segregation protein Spo0J